MDELIVIPILLKIFCRLRSNNLSWSCQALRGMLWILNKLSFRRVLVWIRRLLDTLLRHRTNKRCLRCPIGSCLSQLRCGTWLLLLLNKLSASLLCISKFKEHPVRSLTGRGLPAYLFSHIWKFCFV